MSPFLTDEVSSELSPELSPSQGEQHLHKTVVAMVTKLPQQQGVSLTSIVLRKLYTNYELNKT